MLERIDEELAFKGLAGVCTDGRRGWKAVVKSGGKVNTGGSSGLWPLRPGNS